MFARFVVAALLATHIGGAQPRVDLDAARRIKAEAARNSSVASTVRILADRYGPRLTASPEFEAAAAWTADRMRGWGLSNVHLERWGSFGRAWSLKRFSLHMTAPGYSHLIGVPLAWSASTGGKVTAEPFPLPIDDDDLEKLERDIERIEQNLAGKLKGKAIMATRLERLARASETPSTPRYTEAELHQESLAPDPKRLQRFDYTRLALPEDSMDRAEFMSYAPASFREAFRERQQALRRRLHKFLRNQGAVALLVSSAGSQAGRVVGGGAGWWQAQYPSPLPVIALTAEHYGRVARLTEAGVTVRLEFELDAEISSADVDPPNVLAELPGSASTGEWILVGAHLDSWTGGTGAADNASGCAVVMEAMRILKASGLPLKRSIRAILWSGEEQGNFGSEAYVRRNLGDPEARGRVSAYFNLDDGSGKIRGVYLQGNDAARPFFEKWLEPFRDQGASTVSMRDGGLSDVSPFDAAGIPAFSFIQDPLDYWTHTHHSNVDTFEHVSPADLVQASVVLASILYHAANSPELIPHRPLPRSGKP